MSGVVHFGSLVLIRQTVQMLNENTIDRFNLILTSWILRP